jgi:hypothetical protein
MSYTIGIYRKEVQAAQTQSGDGDFFENPGNIPLFSGEQYLSLKERLLRYGYAVSKENGDSVEFENEEENTLALLTDRALYFEASGEGIFEICMTASEFTDTGEFVKFDPQNGEWE